MKEVIKQLDDFNSELEKTKKDLDKNADKISSYVAIGILGIYIYICGKEVYKEIKKLMED